MTELEPTVTERRRLTRNNIYRMIYHAEEPVSKQEIARELHLSLPTVYQNIQELMSAGLIRIGEIKKSTGGRPPIGYEVVPDVRYSVGAAITANHLRFILCDLKQNQLAERNFSHACDEDPNLGAYFRGKLGEFLEDSCPDRGRILGIGLTIPGIYDEKSDRVVISPTMKMRNISLNSLVEKSEIPIYVVNDSTSAGAAELASMSPDEKKNFVFLFLENGIGGAVYVNGEVYEGTNGRSAEFGHMRIVPGGRVCNCGQRGCLEAYCSALRFTRDIGMTTEQFFASLERGEEASVKLWDDVLTHLALGIVNLRMVFDCDIVLGGFVAEHMEPYLAGLRQMVAEQDPFGSDASYIRITTTRKGGMKGAAWHFTEAFLRGI